MAQMIGEIYPVFGYEYWDIDSDELNNQVKANISLDRQSKNEFYFEPGFLDVYKRQRLALLWIKGFS